MMQPTAQISTSSHRVWGLGFRVWSLGLRVSGLRFGVSVWGNLGTTLVYRGYIRTI